MTKKPANLEKVYILNFFAPFPNSALKLRSVIVNHVRIKSLSQQKLRSPAPNAGEVLLKFQLQIWNCLVHWHHFFVHWSHLFVLWRSIFVLEWLTQTVLGALREHSVTNIFFFAEWISESEYICHHRYSTNEYPNLFGSIKRSQMNIRINSP